MKIWDVEASNGLGFVITHYAQFQLVTALQGGTPILNAACAQDLAELGKYGAINLDVRSKDHLRRLCMKIPQNYIEGSVFKIPFEDGHFQTVVLGEFLEHATEEAGHRAVKECVRVLRSGGTMIVTLPLDGRPNGENRPGNPEGYEEVPFEKDVADKEKGEWSDGVTVHHQTWWSNKMLYDLRKANGLEEQTRAALLYHFTCPIGGWGLVWRKP